MASFQRGSTRFYGDIGTVRVAARRDSTLKETNRLVREFDARRRCVYFLFYCCSLFRLNQLAQQVLQLESQRQETEGFTANLDTEDRSGEW
jgi:hypothetical protein